MDLKHGPAIKVWQLFSSEGAHDTLIAWSGFHWQTGPETHEAHEAPRSLRGGKCVARDAFFAPSGPSAHQHGRLHQDRKPQNILVDAEADRPLVAEFGRVKFAMRSSDETRHA
jgi:serine/threonine protein kinase